MPVTLHVFDVHCFFPCLQDEHCEFPRFLWRHLPSGNQRYWLTQVQFKDNSTELKQHLEVKVWSTYLEVRSVQPARGKCGRHNDCSHKMVSTISLLVVFNRS